MLGFDLEGYKCGHSYEQSNGLGVRIFVKLDRELTDEDRYALRTASDAIVDAIERETIRLDLGWTVRAAQERLQIIALFQQPVFVEEISNGYCNGPCCSRKPWFIITTPTKGRIKIGWRKSVISIDWSDSVINETADEIFPAEDTTKDGRLIHAWGYEKAAEYIRLLMMSADARVLPREGGN
jgi:hypothetical protein